MKLNSSQLYTSLLTISSLIVLVLGFKMFLSGFYSAQTQLHLNQWQSNAKLTGIESWQLAQDSSLKSREWYPVQDSFIEEKIGKVYQWSTYTGPLDNQDAIDKRKIALEAYRSQTNLTPLWPEAWINLMSIKIELNENDVEFNKAFSKAIETSAQYSEIETKLAKIAIQSWHGLDQDTKNKAMNVIMKEVQSSKTNSTNLKPILQSCNMLSLTCLYMNVKKLNSYDLCK